VFCELGDEKPLCGSFAHHPRKRQTGRKAGTQSQGPSDQWPEGSPVAERHVGTSIALVDARHLIMNSLRMERVRFATGSNNMSAINKLKRFLTSEDGPTAVEYAVMLALIIIVCLVAIQAVGTNASTTFTNIGNSLAS
jgi:pilus assembly protein Flp/PilA